MCLKGGGNCSIFCHRICVFKDVVESFEVIRVFVVILEA